MLPTYVALVPFDDQSHVEGDELLHVAAALQTQIVRDLGPVWGVSAVVSPFLSLEQVPAGYFPVTIVGDQLPDQARGFHLAPGGLPVALIKYQAGWSVVASHELIELLCDPYGDRAVTAPSLKAEQGEVDYLVEVCDPCESSTYEINDVPVSDFVTPHYYEMTDAKQSRYTFLGAIERSFGVLPGGYISWQTRLPRRSIWQATPGSKELEFRQVPESPSRFSREWIDARTPRSTPNVRSRTRRPFYAADKGLKRWAAEFRGEIEELLAWLAQEPPRPPSVEEIIVLLDDVVKNWNSYRANPEQLKRELARLGVSTDLGPKLAFKKDYQDVIKALRQQQKVSGLFGPDLFSPDAALWLCMLIG